jgi:hypothetical protein
MANNVSKEDFCKYIINGEPAQHKLLKYVYLGKSGERHTRV